MLAVVGIVVLPLAWRGTSCGHDFDFHLESWMEVVRQWHQGTFYPHWAASGNYGAGEPRFVFYPPASWMLGGALGALAPWTWTPLLFTLIVMRAMAASFFEMAREWISEDNAAIAACLYVLNPYMLFVAYERAAYGELLGAVWLPLLVLYALRKKAALPQLALAIAMLWLTNAPAAVMGCYALALIVLWAAVAERSWRLVRRAVGATALGLGVAAFYLVPAIYEQRWVEIARAIDPGMRVEDSFLFGHTGQLFHDQVLHTASWIAVALLACTAIAAVLCRRKTAVGADVSGREAVPSSPVIISVRGSLIFLAVVIACLLLPFSDVVWRHAPELKFLQFPWRWLLVLGFVGAALAGMCLRGDARTRRLISLRAGLVLLLACGMAGLSSYSFWTGCDDEDNVRAQVTTFHDGGFEGTDEYTAVPAENDEIQQDLPPVRVLRAAAADEGDSSSTENPEWQADASHSLPSQIQIQRWDVEHMRVRIESPAAGYAVLRLMEYPAWKVWVNGQRVFARPRREDGLMVIPVPAGSSLIRIHYGGTRDVWVGRILSLIAIAIWMICRAGQLGLRYPQQVS
jgi:uncharacterized integral membrane protein